MVNRKSSVLMSQSSSGKPSKPALTFAAFYQVLIGRYMWIQWVQCCIHDPRDSVTSTYPTDMGHHSQPISIFISQSSTVQRPGSLAFCAQ